MAQKGYTTEEIVENYVLQDIDESFSTQIDSWIEGVENHIDLITGRNFIADSEASARVYDGDGEHTLLIDDCISIATVEVGEDDYGGTFTEIDSTGSNRYFTEPANASALGQPVHAVILQHRPWTNGKQNNRITAKWGYSESVPADIQFAATVLVAGIINAQRKDTKEIASERIGNYSVTYGSDKEKNDFLQAKEILERYTKILL